MKKMTFALACASTLALFADPISVTGFEGTKGEGNPYGAEGATSAALWSYSGASGSTDGSAAKAYEGSDVSAPTITRPKQAPAGENLNFLDLSTEGGTLWRNFATEGAHTVPATGTYVDTMVQFTATEAGSAPEVAEGDKLALWLDKAEDGTLTLKVLANAYTFDEAPGAEATSFALVTADGSELVLAENAWYRLTVGSIANVLGEEAPGTIQGFQVYVNGVLMKAASGEPFAAAYNDFMDTYKTAALTDKTVFASLLQMGDPGASTTLASVGFKGSGKIDDLVLTDDNPFDQPTPESDYPEYITDDAAKAKFDTWYEVNKAKVTDHSDADGAFKNQYLMNIAADATADLVIDAIEQVETGWKITVSSTAQADLSKINGTLVVETTTALDQKWAAQAIAPAFDKVTGTATITVPAGDAKFMKAVVK